MARVLVIGGNRFVGQELTFRLLAAGHRVTLLNRGNRPDVFGARVERLRADRSTEAFDAALAGLTFDAVFDFALFTGDEARRAARVLEGRCGHYVMISTGQVYLVREGYQWPAREEDYEGPLLPRPTEAYALDEWRYGVDKREAEEALFQSRLLVTAVRLPMVHGPGDYYRRFESVLWRLLDGGPVLVARGEAPARHVFARPVARALAALIGNPRSQGRAYNFSQDDTPTVLGLVREVGRALGMLPELISVSDAELQSAGLTAVEACPFSGTWMSCLDSTRARVELGFTHEPLAQLLPSTVEALLAHFPATPPPSYAKRGAELALGRRLRREG
jgi:nucleoside-diphosphate-sugar epimerase